MLISQPLAAKMYRTDSWVYKNFSKLYSNKLWDKKIPNGYTICPYFWKSLLGFLVGIATTLLFYIGKVLTFVMGRVFKQVDKFMFDKVCFTLKGETEDYVPVIGTIFSLVSVIGTGAVLYGFFLINTHVNPSWMAKYLVDSLNAISMLLASILVYNIYRNFKGIKYDTDKQGKLVWTCIKFWTFTTVPLFIFANLKVVGSFLAYIGVSFYKFILYKFIIGIVWAVLIYNIPYISVPVWSAAIALIIFSWLFSYLVVKLSEYQPKMTSFEIPQDKNEKWINTLTSIYNYKIESSEILENSGFDKYSKIAFGILSYNLIKNAVTKTYGDLFKNMDMTKIPNPKTLDDWDCSLTSRLYRFEEVNKFLDATRFSILKCEFIPNLAAEITAHKAEFVALVEKYKKQELEDKRNKEQREKMWLYKIYVLGLAVTWNVYDWSVEKFDQGIDQAKMFWSYFKLLVIAKKQKACPYFKFEDATKPYILPVNVASKAEPLTIPNKEKILNVEKVYKTVPKKRKTNKKKLIKKNIPKKYKNK